MPGAGGEGAALTLRRVLVVFKKSAYQIYIRERREAHISRLMRERHVAVAHMRRVHADQVRCRRVVARTLRRLRIDATFRYRAERFRCEGHDLVVSVGGDGTLLEAAHHVGDVPILGVNSSPSTSVGFFAGATAGDFEERMREVLTGRLRITVLQRMRVWRNGRPLAAPVLNDVLFCGTNPAATSRYVLTVGDRSEDQKSSGMWIATAAGSTAALRSAGGRVLPAGSRRLGYVVREPYHEPGRPLTLLGGSIAPGTTLSVVTKMRQSAIYADGSHVRFQLELGDRLEFGPHPTPLRIFGFQRPGR